MAEVFDDDIAVARTRLNHALQHLQDHIRNYPTPIAGCDLQFNHLLTERARVRAALDSLDRPFFVPTPRTLTPTAGVESR